MKNLSVKRMKRIGLMSGWLIVSGLIPTGWATEFPIGDPEKRHGMEISAVYLEGVEMSHDDMAMDMGAMPHANMDMTGHTGKASPKSKNIHIEADIRALADNRLGFAEGDFIPYLNINYEVSRITTVSKKIVKKGKLLPMIANDGPHYGVSLQLPNDGNYRLKYTIAPPSAKTGFSRHIDHETGVDQWFAPFSFEREFVYPTATPIQ